MYWPSGIPTHFLSVAGINQASRVRPPLGQSKQFIAGQVNLDMR